MPWFSIDATTVPGIFSKIDTNRFSTKKSHICLNWFAISTARISSTAGIFLKSDERILGDSDFVETVIDAVEEHIEKKSAYWRNGVDLEQAAQRAADLKKRSISTASP